MMPAAVCLSLRTSVVVALLMLTLPTAAQEQAANAIDAHKVASQSLQSLISLQEPTGLWRYEGRYRIEGEIPLTYEVGGTSLACLAIFHGADPGDENAQESLDRGLEAILARLEDPQMKPSREQRYDMRVLAQAYALLLFCHLGEKAPPTHRKSITEWTPRLAQALVFEQMRDGGWNYQGRPVHASFVTASVVQALLWARPRIAQSATAIPREVFLRARAALTASRTPTGAFQYFGTRKGMRSPANADHPAGSAARSGICESMLLLLGGGSRERVLQAIDGFHRHWDELEKRRQKSGTHEGPFLIAPYYFYYGHRYTAQAIELLPKRLREGERQRLHRVLMRSRGADGTFNDREFTRARAYGTSMAILTLLADQVPLPPALGD